MSLFQIRRPPFKILLFAGCFFAALCGYALATDTMIIPPSRTQHGKVILRKVSPGEYWFTLRFFGVLAVTMCSTALVRFNPLEDKLRAWNEKIHRKAAESGATTKPAPVWAYLLLTAVIGLVIYLGYLFMYKE